MLHLIVASALLANAASTDNTLPQAAEIADTIEQNWSKINGISVKYTCHQKRLKSVEGALVPRGPHSALYMNTYQGSLIYWNALAEGEIPLWLEMSYDGQIYYERRTVAKEFVSNNVVVPSRLRDGALMRTGLATVDGPGFYFECLACPNYEGRGWLINLSRKTLLISSPPHVLEDKRPYSLVNALRTGLYRATQYVTFGNARCIEVIGPGDHLWLDTTLNFALRRRLWDWRPGGPRQLEINLNDYRTVENDQTLKLPYDITMQIYAMPLSDHPCPAEPMTEVSVAVRETIVGPFKPEKFRLEASPGMTVIDSTSLRGIREPNDKSPVIIRAGESPEATQAALDAAIRGISYRNNHSFFVINVAILLIIAGILAYRRWNIQSTG